MIITVNFIFSSEIIFDFEWMVGSKIYTSRNVSEQNWFSWLDDFTLSFESSVWLNIIDDPNSLSISSAGRHERNLFTWDWCTNSWRMFHTNKTELFPKEIFVCNNSNLLAKSHILITSENIKFFDSGEVEYRSSHWTWILSFASASNCISFINIWNSISNIHDNPTLCLLVLDHDGIIPSEIAVVRVWPWHLFVTCLILWNSSGEWKLSSLLFTLIIVLLNSGQFHVFIPVSNSSLMMEFWSSL